MIPTRLDALPGLRVARGAGETPVRGVSIDSRTVEPGDLFVAIRGGHEHVAAAAAAGAAAVLVDERRSGGGGVPVLAVAPDTVAALAAIGRHNRERAAGCTVVGVTGSAGKTSTKDTIATLAAGAGRRVVAAASGHNNEIGLPLTLCRIAEDTEVAVCEMGMRGAGQIAALGELAAPTVGAITNVAPVHLELLGSLEAIARAKAELVAALPPGGAAILPAGEPLLDPYRRDDLRNVTFGEAPEADVRILARRPLPDGSSVEVEVEGRTLTLETNLRGAHGARNLAAALAVCLALGLAPEDVAPAAREIALQRWRGESLPLAGGGVVVNDAWNANPLGMRAALESLAERTEPGRRVAVLGEMAELGPTAAEHHRAVGAAAAALGVEVLVAVGPLARGYLEGAGPIAEPYWLPDRAELLDLLRRVVRPDDVVLVKASRVGRLEDVAAGLAEAPLKRRA